MSALSGPAVSRRAALVGGTLAATIGPGARAAAEPRAPFIDVHAHPVTNLRESHVPPIAAFLGAMDARTIARTALSPPPMLGEAMAYRLAERSLAAQAPDRFAFNAGGEVLNGMLQRTAAAAATPELVEAFRAAATSIAEAGAAGFAELGVEVFPSGRAMKGGHQAQQSPADHPFLFALTDVAAQFSMPLCAHMEAITSGAENISGFERLVSHNPEARIVWLHAGWDRTGQRTVALMRALLQRHANLYMTLKSDHVAQFSNAPLDGSGKRLKREWLALLGEFPDRFAIGSDQFYNFPTYERLDRVRQIIDALPPDLARQIGLDNPPRIYRLAA